MTSLAAPSSSEALAVREWPVGDLDPMAFAACGGLGDLTAFVDGDDATIGRGVARAWPASTPGNVVSTTLRELRGALAFAALPFDPAAPREPVWGALGAGGIVVPSLCLSTRRRTLTAVGPRTWVDAIDVPSLVARVAITGGDPRPPKVVDEDDGSRVSYPALVERCLAEIAAGRVHKVVPARESRFAFAAALDPVDVLRRLPSEGVTRFCVQRGDRAFLGATPETLLAVTEGRLTTEAVAGTSRCEEAGALLASDKDAREHAVVVDALVAELASMGTVSREPRRLREAPGVTHLVTPIAVALTERVHVLDAARRLSPTPAVGGFPRDAALAVLRREEGLARGLFAGAIGRFDGAGAGRFVVAIRAALLHGASARVLAGAGVVAGSVPSAELDETRWKQAPLRRALGVA